MALETNTLRSLFSDTLILFPENSHLHLAVADAADKPLNISRHASTINISRFSTKKFFIALLGLTTKSNVTGQCRLPVFR